MSNLFDPKLSLDKTDFDLVVGNPPWVSRGKQKDEHFLAWQKQNPAILGPDKQIAHGFMWKACNYLSDAGVACLLLPSAVLFNDHTNQFQKEWFSSVTVEKVVNFSDLRFLLFEEAIHPCIAIRFLPKKSNLGNCVLYEVPKADARSQRGGPVYLREEDIADIPVKKILEASSTDTAPLVWKMNYWGSWRDQKLLSRLNNLPKLGFLAGEATENKRWLKGQGIQVAGGDPNPVWWDSSLAFLSSNEKIDLAISISGLPTARQAKIPCNTVHRPRDKHLFAGPKVLISQGANDMKVAYCDLPLLFKSALQSITGKKRDAKYLRFLSAVVKSDIAQYYLFHTSANWGVERDKSLFYEVLSLPFFLPENAYNPQKAEQIINEVSNVVEKFQKHLDTKSWLNWTDESRRIRHNILEPLVRAYYDIDKYEAMLIDDTRDYAMKSFHPKEYMFNIPTLQDVQLHDQSIYASTLSEMLNFFGKGSQFKVCSEVYRGNPYSVVKVFLSETVRKTAPVMQATGRLSKIFERMTCLLEQRHGRMTFCQNLKVFDADSLYILKPKQMRFWTKTSALNDADEIAGTLLDSKGMD